MAFCLTKVRRDYAMHPSRCSRCKTVATKGVCPRGCGSTNTPTYISMPANPMLYKRLGEAGSLCVLRVSLDALTIPGAVITDSNAASDYARFLHPSQWTLINFDDVLAENWTHPGDPRRYFQHKSRKCAEVLVPHRIPLELLTGACVIDAAARERLALHAPHLPAVIDPVLFFQ